MATNKCKTCKHCKHFFELCVFRYWADNRTYYCTLYDRLTSRDGICENHAYKTPEYDLSPERFDSVIQDVQAISEYIKKL